MQLNRPPHWPNVPDDAALPPYGWRPDPAWGPPPPHWRLLVDPKADRWTVATMFVLPLLCAPMFTFVWVVAYLVTGAVWTSALLYRRHRPAWMHLLFGTMAFGAQVGVVALYVDGRFDWVNDALDSAPTAVWIAVWIALMIGQTLAVAATLSYLAGTLHDALVARWLRRLGLAARRPNTTDSAAATR